MAGGKSKSKASKKKGPAEATTSAPQPFPYLDGSFLEFGSEEELTRFITHFAKRPISSPRVLPELFPHQKGYHDLDNQLKESAEKRLLLYILTRILRPRDDSHTSLFNDDLRVIHAIMHGASINWAKYIMIHMTDCASILHERSLPYAFLVMDLIVSADILIVGPSTKMTKLWVIADNTFKKKSGNRNGAGTSRACAPARAPAPARASLQSIADTLNRLTLTVDGMGQYMERMDWTLQRQHHDMRAFFRGINYAPPPFDSTILGQNYEGKDEDDDSYAPSSSPDEANFEDAVDGDPMDVEDDEGDDDDEDEDADA
ncbi:unnamed protein product [Cuscuta campestris]|uniref:Uncharacterized protein n=1 Tax=Cuscuta campestris TaxID=132261 RepID=A0A484KVK3_9ASTE|nr:unnamed protein product [Cuscuta campestris]